MTSSDVVTKLAVENKHRPAPSSWLWLVMGGVLLASGALFSRTSLAAQEAGQGAQGGSQRGQTLEGVVSDSMCGAKHKMADAAKCTAGCVSHGGGYALVVGDKVYKLEGKTEGLDKLAGAKAKVTGTVSGDTITVQSVAAAS